MTIYYVDQVAGNDANTGLSDAQAWKNIGKVNAFVFATSDQVYLKCGSTFTDAKPYIDWGGTSGARVVIGAYYMSGGVGTETIGVSGAKPIIDRGWNGSTWSTYPVYTNGFEIEAPYVTVQDIKVQNVLGRGIVSGSSSSAGPAIIQRVDISTTFMEGSVMDYGSGDGWTISDCTYTRTVQAYPLGATSSSWPGNASTTTTNNGKFQRNSVNGTGGEGISPGSTSGTGSSGTLIEDCTFCNCHSDAIYPANHNYAVIRRNLCYDITSTTYSGHRMLGGLAVSDETGKYGATGNQFYNNLVAFVISGMYIDSSYGSFMKNNLYYQNTIVDCDVAFRAVGTLFSGNVIKDNIFADYTGTDTMDSGTPASGFTFDYNCWHRSPSANATGANDYVGDPKLSKTSGWRSIVAQGGIVYTNFGLTDVTPAAVRQQGVFLPGFSDTDYHGTTRPNPPSMGGLQYVATTGPIVSSDSTHDMYSPGYTKGNWSGASVGTYPTNQAVRSYIRFPITTLTHGLTLKSVVLELLCQYVTGNANDRYIIGPYNADGVANPDLDTGVTCWNRCDPSGKFYIYGDAKLTATGSLQWELGSKAYADLMAALGANDTYFTVAVRQVNEVDSGVNRLVNIDGPGSGVPATLTISTTPPASPSIFGVGSGTINDTDTGVVVSGNNFGDTQSNGWFELNSATNGSGTSVVQTPTAFSNTSLTFNVTKGALSYGTVYAIYHDNNGNQSSGYAVTLQQYVAPPPPPPPPPVLSSVSISTLVNGQVNVTVTGTNFGASRGAGHLDLNTVSDGSGSAQAQTITSWADTSVAFTVVRGTLPYGTLYLVLYDNNGDHSNGIAVTIPQPASPAGGVQTTVTQNLLDTIVTLIQE